MLVPLLSANLRSYNGSHALVPLLPALELGSHMLVSLLSANLHSDKGGHASVPI